MIGELLIGLFCCIPTLVVGIPVLICTSEETKPENVEEKEEKGFKEFWKLMQPRGSACVALA